MVRIASATGVPWATSTSTWRSLATLSSGLRLFLDMDPSSFGSQGILQGGPLQSGRISSRRIRAKTDPQLTFTSDYLMGAGYQPVDEVLNWPSTHNMSR